MAGEAESQPGACRVTANNNNRSRLRLVCRVMNFLFTCRPPSPLWGPCNTSGPLTEENRHDTEPQAVVAGVRVAGEAELAVGYMVVAVLAVRRWRWRRQGRGRGGAGRAAFSWCSSSVVDVPVALQRQVPAVPLLWRAPIQFIDSGWTFLLCGRDVYPQCKLCGRPQRHSRCCSGVNMLDKFQQVTGEVAQLQFTDRVWFSSLTTETGTQGQTVQTVEIPQLQFLNKLFMGLTKVVDVPAMRRRENTTIFFVKVSTWKSGHFFNVHFV